MDTDNILLFDNDSLSFGLEEIPQFPEDIELPTSKPAILNKVLPISNPEPTRKIPDTIIDIPKKVVSLPNRPSSNLDQSQQKTQTVVHIPSTQQSILKSHHQDLQKKSTNNELSNKKTSGESSGPIKTNSFESFDIGGLNIPKETAYFGIGLIAVSGLLFYLTGKKKESEN